MEEGTTIAVYHKATAGEEGRDQDGMIIPARRGLEKSVLMGTGFQVEPDGVTYTATITGKITYKEEHLTISPLMVVDGDITGKEEPLRFHGDVLIKGSVCEDGYVIATGDVAVMGACKRGTIISGGDTYICGDSVCEYEGVIQAKGRVYGNSFAAAKITAVKGAYTNRLVKTDITTREKIHVFGRKGAIIGGVAASERGIDVNNIGNEYREETRIVVGYNEHTRRREERLTSEYEKAARECNHLLEAQKALRKRLSDHTIPRSERMDSLLLSLEEAVEEKLKERNELFGEKQVLVKMRERVNSLPIRIRGMAYMGSSVCIDNKTYAFYKSRQHVILQKKNGEVIIRKE